MNSVLFSERDIEILRLLCWCQYIQPEDLIAIFTAEELAELSSRNLIRQLKNSDAFALTSSGVEFISRLFKSEMPILTYTYRLSLIERRLRVSKLALTAYRAGINIFTMSPEDLLCSTSLFLTSITRGKGSNPWGSTRVAALAHLGDLLCAVHYVCPGIGRIALTNELAAFSNQTAQFRKTRRALIFAGESYTSVLEELESMTSEPNAKRIYYGDAYQCVRLPIHLLSCDDTGAMQLQLMAVPKYRTRLTQAALKSHYQPPPKNAASWDAIFKGMPFVMAVDMDLRRVDNAFQIAEAAGCEEVAIAALEGQAESVLYPRYRERGANIFVLTNDALERTLEKPPGLYVPRRTQYLTQKGDVVDVPLIQAGRKAGGHR